MQRERNQASRPVRLRTPRVVHQSIHEHAFGKWGRMTVKRGMGATERADLLLLLRESGRCWSSIATNSCITSR